MICRCQDKMVWDHSCFCWLPSDPSVPNEVAGVLVYSSSTLIGFALLHKNHFIFGSYATFPKVTCLSATPKVYFCFPLAGRHVQKTSCELNNLIDEWWMNCVLLAWSPRSRNKYENGREASPAWRRAWVPASPVGGATAWNGITTI